MTDQQLKTTAKAMVAPGKGILAADESTGDEQAARGRRGRGQRGVAYAFRNLILTTEGTSEFISGVILYDETLRQKNEGRHTHPGEFLAGRGVLPGDQGRYRGQAAGRLSRREGDRGARRPA